MIEALDGGEAEVRALDPVLDVADLTIRFGDGAPLVKGFGLTIAPGELVCVAGESGSGKSISAQDAHGLLAATPNPVPGARVATTSLAGAPPSPFAKAPGCTFVSRCPDRIGRCETERPPANAFSDGDRVAACWRSAELDARAALSDSEDLMSPACRLQIGLLRRARARADA